MNNFIETAKWLHAAGKRPGNQQHASLQIGCHLEEICEFLREVTLMSNTGISGLAMQEVAGVLSGIANNLKSGNIQALVYDREAALDALCDADITGNGVAYLMGLIKDEADARVIASNWDKFNNGVPVIKPGGKVGKREGWVPPKLSDLANCDALAALDNDISGTDWRTGAVALSEGESECAVEVITPDCRVITGTLGELFAPEADEVAFWRLA